MDHEQSIWQSKSKNFVRTSKTNDQLKILLDDVELTVLIENGHTYYVIANKVHLDWEWAHLLCNS